MPVEFVRETCTAYGHYTVCDSTKLVMAYDGFGRRISKTRMRKDDQRGYWYTDHVTHYTGIGSEIRKEYHNGELQSTKVVVNMPQGLGRYGIENADGMAKGDEFYLKNHLGSTMMVAQVSSTNASEPAKVAAAYDYRSFGGQVTLTESADKVTENFTGKEHDDEIALDYFGARYLDPMLGMWISVDPAGFFSSSYLYMGNEYNPIRFTDVDGMRPGDQKDVPSEAARDCLNFYSSKSKNKDVEYFVFVWELENGKFATNTRMFEGTNNSFGEKQIYDAAVKSRPFGAKKAVAGAHLHGGENDKYDSEVFSEEDYSTFVKPLNIDLFLLTPRESFQRMDTDRNVEFLDELPEVNVK